MDDAGFWVRFVPAVLATWRITHLLAYEDGPAGLIARFRARLGAGFLGELMDCFQCLSLWIAAPLAFFVARHPLDGVVAWLALSGAACLAERAGERPAPVAPLGHGREDNPSEEGETE
ncbi:MAG TPA: DUF1360 domain-containing protein [Bryobacteraceae bacterium]|nr:DUF1360 domain-containing protein [Bryobacteraceae bacterium]